jgi:Rrf2 family protein
MQLSRAVEHGVRSMQYLASREGVVHGDEIAARMGIPVSFLRKILQRLASSGLVRSHRGFAGGFSLARNADDITLLQIIEAVDGEVFLSPCLKGDSDCVLDHNCSLQRAWASGQKALRQTLAGYSLRSLVTEEVPTVVQ